MGRLSPAGTGAAVNRLKVTAAKRDRELEAKQAAAAVEAAEAIPAEPAREGQSRIA